MMWPSPDSGIIIVYITPPNWNSCQNISQILPEIIAPGKADKL